MKILHTPGWEMDTETQTITRIEKPAPRGYDGKFDKWVLVGICLFVLALLLGLAVLIERTTERYKSACEADGGTFIDARNGMFCIKDKR